MTAKERRAVVAAEKALRRVEYCDGGEFDDQKLCPLCGVEKGDAHSPKCELALAKVALLEVLMEDQGGALSLAGKRYQECLNAYVGHTMHTEPAPHSSEWSQKETFLRTNLCAAERACVLLASQAADASVKPKAENEEGGT